MNLESDSTPIRFFSATESVSSMRKKQTRGTVRVSSTLYLKSQDASPPQYG